MLHVLRILVVEHARVFILFHIALRRLVSCLFCNLHLSKSLLLLRQLCSLLFLFLFSISLCLLISLNLSELIEYILVMQESVSKFLFKDFCLKETSDSLVQYGYL